MTQIEMRVEFEYALISRDEIVEALVTDGHASDVTDRVKRVIQRLAQTRAGDTEHKGNYYPSGQNWSEAISAYVGALNGKHDWTRTGDHGTLQFESFADEDYGAYWIVNLSHYRGEAFNREYLVILSEGISIGQITLAFTVDDLDLAYQVIRPMQADWSCANPDCSGRLETRDGYSLRTEQDYRYEPEFHEYDLQGMHCPFCTVYLTKVGEEGISATERDAFGIVNRQLQEPFYLRAVYTVTD